LILAPTIAAFAEGGGGLLSPDGSILVIFLLFIALVPALNRLIFRPISHILNERDRLTVGTDTDVRAMLGTIDQNLAAYEEGIRGARAEGYRLLEGRRALATAERQAQIDAARTRSAEQIAAAREEIGRDAESARGRLVTDAKDIARTISSSVLGRAVGGKQ
jgi:F0F1-type ATP synthase membrane subunit b/b'